MGPVGRTTSTGSVTLISVVVPAHRVAVGCRVVRACVAHRENQCHASTPGLCQGEPVPRKHPGCHASVFHPRWGVRVRATTALYTATTEVTAPYCLPPEQIQEQILPARNTCVASPMLDHAHARHTLA